MLSLTLRNAYYPTLSFLIMFFIIFVGCGQAFNMAVRNLTPLPVPPRSAAAD